MQSGKKIQKKILKSKLNPPLAQESFLGLKYRFLGLKLPGLSSFLSTPILMTWQRKITEHNKVFTGLGANQFGPRNCFQTLQFSSVHEIMGPRNNLNDRHGPTMKGQQWKYVCELSRSSNGRTSTSLPITVELAINPFKYYPLK